MKKLKLDLDALQVETFEAERAPALRGTVQANFTSGPFACQDQCYSNGCSDFGCPSEHCSGWECGSLSGCVSYEVANCTVEC